MQRDKHTRQHVGPAQLHNQRTLFLSKLYSILTLNIRQQAQYSKVDDKSVDRGVRGHTMIVYTIQFQVYELDRRKMSAINMWDNHHQASEVGVECGSCE